MQGAGGAAFKGIENPERQPTPMRKQSLTSEARFASIAAILLGKPGVTGPSEEARAKRSFGSNGLRINNKIFVMLVRDQLVLKLPRQRVDALIASGDGERFDPGHGRLMKEWLALNPTSREEWLPLAQEAMKFVASQR
jgi:hypothetical protein